MVELGAVITHVLDEIELEESGKKEMFVTSMAEPVAFALKALLCRGYCLDEIAQVMGISLDEMQEVIKEIL